MGNCCGKWCPCCACCIPKPSKEPRIITPNLAVGHLPVKDKTHPNHKFKGNKIKTAKYTPWDFAFLNLYKQFHAWTNWYFLSVVIINFIPQISAFANYLSWLPLVTVLLSTAAKDAVEDYHRAKADKRLNNAHCLVYSGGHYEVTTWQHINPGDIVRIHCNEAFPADILLLRSSDPQAVCYVETANLDGESNLKQREVLKCFHDQKDFVPEAVAPYRFLVEAPNSEVYRINGTFYRDTPRETNNPDSQQPTVESDYDDDHKRPGSPHLRDQIPINKENLLLRGCKLRNTDFVEGIVIYAGHETKVMMNDDGPRFKRSKLELRIQEDTIYCGILLFCLCSAGAVGEYLWVASFGDASQVPFLAGLSSQYSEFSQGVITFFIFIIYLQSVIPLPLFVSQELVKILQIMMMENDLEMYHEPSNRKLACRAWNLSEDLGRIEYVFTDKTGTLTENVMTFRRCVVNGSDYTFNDPRLNAGQTTDENSCTVHHSVTGIEPCPHCTHVPELQTRDSDIKKLSLQTLMERPQIQIGTASSYTPLPLRPSSALAMKMNENSVSFLHHFVLMMAVCNTVVVSAKNHHEKKSSADAPLPPADPTDAPSAQQQDDLELDRLLESYEAESADEMALVKAACVMGCKLLKRTKEMVLLTLPGESEPVHFNVLKVLPFDSDRKRMSIIVQHPINETIIVYCKGADSSILSRLNRQYEKASNPTLQRTKHVIDEYAKLGLRTLCFAKRVLGDEEYESWAEIFDAAERATENRAAKFFEAAQLIESNLTLLGAVGIEDKLQELVPETIQSLRDAGMHVWMLTGDKQETAVNIGYSCRLLDPKMKVMFLNESDGTRTRQKIETLLSGVDRIKEKIANRMNEEMGSSEESAGKIKLNMGLVIDGATLKYVLEDPINCNVFVQLVSQCKSVLCSRTTPLQKGSVVKLVMDKLNKYSLAIGDGANDVSMIKTANVGIGITGREGLQATMASDYAIAKFKYLKRLLLVHGHWSNYRFGMLALIIFYKQIIWTSLFFWFQIYNGFSAIVMIDQIYQLSYTLINTAAPPIYMGVLDQVVGAEVLMREPSLYGRSRKGQYYSRSTFWIFFADGVYQSLVVFFLAYSAYSDTSYGMWEFGALCYFASITSVIATCIVETRYWNAIGVVCILASFFGTWLLALIYNASPGAATGIPPDDPYWVLQNHLQTIQFWTVQAAAVLLSVLPRVVVKLIGGLCFPTAIDLARRQQKQLDEQRAAERRKEHEHKLEELRKKGLGSMTGFGWHRMPPGIVTPAHNPSPADGSASGSNSNFNSPSVVVSFENKTDLEATVRIEVAISPASGEKSLAAEQPQGAKATPGVASKPSATNRLQVAPRSATKPPKGPLKPPGRSTLPPVAGVRRNNLLSPPSFAPPTNLAAQAEARRSAARDKRSRNNRVGTVPEETSEDLGNESAPTRPK